MEEKNPNILYHYCSADTFYEIIKSKSLPARNYELSKSEGILDGYTKYYCDVEKGQPARLIEISDSERNRRGGSGSGFDGDFQSSKQTDSGGQAAPEARSKVTFPTPPLGAKIKNGMPQGTGAASINSLGGIGATKLEQG